MANKQILEKAIKKAIDGGWNFDHWRRRSGLVEGEKPNGDAETSLIFNHDFAKALWGEDRILGVDRCYRCLVERDPFAWQYHLQQMVIAASPIEYLGAHLDG